MISDKIKRLLEVTKEENARLLKEGRVKRIMVSCISKNL